MQIEKVNNSKSFGARYRLNDLEKSLDKVAKNIGVQPEMIVGTAALSGLSSSAGAVATANYSGLAKILPINVSIPLGTALASTASYKSFVCNARNTMEQQAKNAKRKGEAVTQQADPDFIKIISKNLKERFLNIFKLNRK